MLTLRGRGRLLGSPLVGAGLVALALTAMTASLAPAVGTDWLLAVALLYLLIVLVASAIWGYAIGIGTALAADALVNFFFVPPLHRFSVAGAAHAVALFVFLAVAIVGSTMLALLRSHAQRSEAARMEASTLLELSRMLARSVSEQDAMQQLCHGIVRALRARGCAIAVRTPDWQVLAASGGLASLMRSDEPLANAALASGGPVRALTPGRNQAASQLVFVPFPPESDIPGVLRIAGELHPPALVEIDPLLASLAAEASLAVRRSRLRDEARHVEALRDADELKSALLSTVSHDLRTPLTAITASVEALRDPAVALTAEDSEGFLQTIALQAGRLTATVSGLLDMSRLEGSSVQPLLESVDVGILLDDVRVSLAPLTAGRPVTVSVPDGTFARGDYVLLAQALANLVTNAVRHSNPGGPICLSATTARGRVNICVADSGPGVPAADLPHIFEKFFRGSEARGEGTGLGLAIVKALAELSGGGVSVESTGRGTTFAIELPAASAR